MLEMNKMNNLTRDVWRRLDAGDVSKNKYLMKKSDVVSPVVEPVTNVDLGDVVMDLEPALDGWKSQYDWIAYWNKIQDGRVMASLADYYVAAKSGDASLISSLRNDFSKNGFVWNGVVCSDRIFYEKDSLDATIISYYGSTKITPIERKVYIPYYYGVSLDSVLSDSLGLAYLQSLFRTSDGVEVMKSTLFDLSGKKSSETRVRTPDQNDRDAFLNLAAFLYNDDLFSISSGISLYNNACSRGVRLK